MGNENNLGIGNKFIPDFEPAYTSLPREKALSLEEQVKGDYELSDWKDPQNPKGYLGWKIKYKTEDREIIYSPNSRYITTREYLKKNERNEPLENVLDLVARISVNIATAEKKYGNEDVLGTAKKFAKRIISREFAPNSPTFANAGRPLQQLAACFGMIPEDHLATDDIGDDPEKQGNGIYDILRYGAMIQKSGGGTGYNFSYTRPKNSGIAIASGRASGPVSWLRAYNGSTREINQGGFRRGANMGVLEYWHPDLFEFLSAKANHKIAFFNLSMGIDEEFWNKFEEDGHFYLINPKNMDTVPLEERIWTSDRLIKKSEFEELDQNERNDLDPSLLIDEKNQVVVRYTGKTVGFVDNKERINISAKATLEYVAEMAHETGCPGLIFFDKMNIDNPTPHFGTIRVVNPCGEQPLLNFEACNLNSPNVYTCVEEARPSKDGFHRFGANGKFFYGKVIGEGEQKYQKRIDLKKLEEIVKDSIHFLDNVIDMSKYPFKKIYSNVKANRKVGSGIMGVAETAMALGINYESEDMEELSEFLSSFMHDKSFKASAELAKERGEFPNWEGSIYDPNSKYAKKGKTGKIRNATRLTIAPNGTTGQFAGVTGGIEPMFGLYFEKNLVGGKSLSFRNEIFEDELIKRGLYNEGLIKKIKEEKSVQDIDEIPQDMKERYKLSIEIDPVWHVRIQGAFQRGKNGKGIDNAVSKTVNLPSEATQEDVLNIFLESRKKGCKGITVYRDGTIEGQPLTVGKSKKDIGEIVRINVPLTSKAISIADNANKYRIERGEEDVFHVIFTDELRRHKETGNIYFFPKEDFQTTAPPGDEISVEFTVAGIDRTDLLKGPDPDYAKIIERWKSVTGNRSEGFSDNRINSPSHAVGLAFEHALLSRGIIGYENNKIVNLIRKPESELLSKEDKKILLENGNGEVEQMIASKKISGFLCECGSTKYIFEQGCHEPVCAICRWSKRGSCS